jgi:hypothetical protein
MEEQIQETATLNPIALGFLLILVCLTCLLPRRLAFCPVIIMIGVMPMGQQIEFFGLHFYLFRIVMLAGILRTIVRGEIIQLKLTGMDKLFVGWVIVSVVFGTLAKPSMELFINRSGDAYNALCCYFFARCVIVEFEDIVINVRALAFVSILVATLMLIEKITSHNLLSVFGGVPEITSIRDGKLRCQGAFRHPILAGDFGATQFPLFFALWKYNRRYRLSALVAMGASVIIVVSASSSGAILGLVGGIAGLVLWKFRKSMQLIRWGGLAVIISLAMVMEAPVWYLFARLSSVMGGTGWHRAWLIDQALKHLDEWWLFGTTYTAHWGPGGLVIAADPNMMDITNHFIMEGVKGGVLKLGLFIALIVSCFNKIGWRLRSGMLNSSEGFFVWVLGVSVFTHCLSFLSVHYFDQTILIWYWILATICGIKNTSPASVSRAGNSLSHTTIKVWRYSRPKVASSCSS